MKTQLLNTSLKRDINTILSELDNVNGIKKGTVSGYSIEIEYKEPSAVNSFIYYDNKSARDKDLKELTSIIKSWKKQNTF